MDDMQIVVKTQKALKERLQHIEEVDKQIEKIATAEEKLTVLQQFKL